MTTGRINQVAILNPRTAAQKASRRRRNSCYKLEGSRRSAPSHAPPSRRTYRKRTRPIQLPPPSSPKDGPPRRGRGLATAKNTATCAPREEETRDQSRPRTDTGHRNRPQRSSRTVASSQPSTDPGCPLIEDQRDFWPLPQALAQRQLSGVTCFNIMGITPPGRVKEMHPAPNRRADQSWRSLPLSRKQGVLVRNHQAQSHESASAIGGFQQARSPTKAMVTAKAAWSLGMSPGKVPRGSAKRVGKCPCWLGPSLAHTPCDRLKACCRCWPG